MQIDALLPYLVGLFMAFMFIGFSIVAWQKHLRDRERIRDYLLAKGYRDIAIHYEWFDFDKSNSTYRVEGRSPAGVRAKTTCKIHRFESLSDDIFWKDQL